MQRDLAERARDGDHDAFSAIAAASLGRLYGVACLILRDRDRAHDATQEALVQAWRDIRGLRHPERLDAWLNRLVVRACYRQSRREQRRAVVELRVVRTAEMSLPGPELSVVDRDRLDRAFGRLDTDGRAVVVLHHYLGLPLTEAADVLAIPVGTAKSRLHRALATIRAALEADDRGGLIEKERSA